MNNTPDPAKPRPCYLCGSTVDADAEPIVKRGAITVALDPIIVRWRGRYVPFSRTEANLFAIIARRGRMLHIEIEEAMTAIDASPATKSVVLNRIRRKLQQMGACDPIGHLGKDMIVLTVDPDEVGKTGLTIGAKGTRYDIIEGD